MVSTRLLFFGKFKLYGNNVFFTVFSKNALLLCFCNLAWTLAYTAQHCPQCFPAVLLLLVFIYELLRYEPKCEQNKNREGFVYISVCLWQKAWIGLNMKKCVHGNLRPLDASFRVEKAGVRTFISSLVLDLLWVSSSDTVLPVRNRRGSSD